LFWIKELEQKCLVGQKAKGKGKKGKGKEAKGKSKRSTTL